MKEDELMADTLNAVFYSFWTFAGTVVLLAIVASIVCAFTSDLFVTLNKMKD